ncbi:Laminin subunit alpha-2, partial [Stegodyphus mimosarum]
MLRFGGSEWLWILSVISLLSVALPYQKEQTYLNDDILRGLFPNVFNLAATSVITVNATCGEAGPEVYCKLVEHVYLRE